MQDACMIIPKRMPFISFLEKNTKEGQPQNDFPPFLFKNKYIMSGNNSQKGSPKGNLYLDHKIRTQPRADILLSSRSPSGFSMHSHLTDLEKSAYLVLNQNNSLHFLGDLRMQSDWFNLYFSFNN